MPRDHFASRFFSGRELYGDDFTQDEIDQWFESEREGYASLVGAKRGQQPQIASYTYHALNWRGGFRYLPKARRFRHALGVGSAYGLEFLPIARRIDELTILEPSQLLVSEQIGGLTPKYVEPSPSGTMPFPASSFDLVVCLGTLHHIPNVSHVVAEIGRVLGPGGYALIREPIVTMGDWRTYRGPGCTDCERGIPLDFLLRAAKNAGLHVQNRSFSGFPITMRMGHLLGIPTYNSTVLTAIDGLVARWSLPFYSYHAENWLAKLRPTSAFLVTRK